MARRGRGSKVRRDAFVIASPDLSLSSGLPVLSAPFVELEDLRDWSPVGPTNRRAFSLPRSSAGLVDNGALRRGVRFAVPEDVLVCVRRKTRREVIFARTGGGGGMRRGRRGRWSDVSCRR